MVKIDKYGMNILSRIFQHNVLATIFINFKLLPFRQAIKFPIEVFHKFRMTNLQGRLILDVPVISRGMIQIGCYGSEMFSHNDETILYLAGDWHCKGKVSFGIGSCLRIERGACMITEDDVVVGARNLVFCENGMVLKQKFLSSWDCTIIDTDRHDVINTKTRNVTNPSAEIVVGEHTWVGNSASIQKGTKLPANSIVASHSLCNKDYSSEGEYCIFAGVPAKKICENREWNR